MARLRRQLLKILKLGAAVAFAEGMNIVHIALDQPGRFGESVGAQALKEGRLLKPPMNIGHAGFNELAKLELVAVLGDLHRPQLPGPCVHVLKKMLMDGAKMDEVKTARGRAFGDPLVRVPYAELISENV